MAPLRNVRFFFPLLLFFLFQGSAAAAALPQPSFSPVSVAKAETELWKAYYDKNLSSLYRKLALLLKTQYPLTEIAADELSLAFTTAAMRFRSLPSSSAQKDYTARVLPLLQFAYELLKREAKASWDPAAVAEKELGWWTFRRSTHGGNVEEVAQKIADLYLLLYQENNKGHFIRAAYLRAAAARYRDLCYHVWGNLEGNDWEIIGAMLEESYQQLAEGIASPR